LQSIGARGEGDFLFALRCFKYMALEWSGRLASSNAERMIAGRKVVGAAAQIDAMIPDVDQVVDAVMRLAEGGKIA
jgi:hypothetical protein